MRSTRRTFLKTAGLLSAGTFLTPAVCSAKTKKWKIAFVQDTSIKTLGGHGLDTAFYGLPDIEVVGHVDSNEKNIEKRMAVTRAKNHFKTIEDLYKKTTPDIVVLTSRLPYQHLEQIRQIAEKGSHVYCEKPLVSSLEDADEIVRIIGKYNTKITVAHPRRYDLGFVTMKKLIQTGKIGVPVTMQGWSKNDHRGGGEDMLVLGTHILDLFVFLFGPPLQVYGEVYSDGKPFTGPPLTKTVEPIGPTAGDEIFATFRFANGVHGIYTSRRKLYNKSDYPMGVSVIGSTGMLSQHFSDAHRERQPLRYNNIPTSPANNSFSETIALKEERIIPGAVSLKEAFGNEKNIVLGPIFGAARRFAVWDLMQSIQEDRQPVCNAFDARTVMEMIYGVYTSHFRKQPIDFPLQDRKHPLAKFM